MSLEFLKIIERPDDLRALRSDELTCLAAEIRKRMIEVTSENGGHLASSLGAVEIIIALHRVFDFSSDRLVFDVGHQSYAHKLLTGREAQFDTLRTLEGICGFPKRVESVYDAHDAGHASDSLSIACGLAVARDLRGGHEEVVAMIGDASLSGGIAFEALNQIGHDGRNMIIVLNDNEMSISKNVGALSLYLGKVRMSKSYTLARDTVEGSLESLGKAGRALVNAGEAAKSSVKKLMVPGMFFEDMGITYVGPIDGHDIAGMEEALLAAQQVRGPVLIHAVTQKGRGYAPAEALPEVYHGVGRFNPETGEQHPKVDDRPTFTEVFGETLVSEAAVQDRIIAITAGMTAGTGLVEFKDSYPERFVDVGIAEEHAVALAAGLALGGMQPVVAIYSTFLQRSYDQIVIDVALQELPVVFCVDRAGLVGEDGATHQGAFDLVYLRSIPNMRIIAPSTAQDLKRALHTALHLKDGPLAIRYPRGVAPLANATDHALFARDSQAHAREQAQAHEKGDEQSAAKDTDILTLGKALKLREGGQLTLMAVGNMVSIAEECAELLAAKGFEASVYDMLWVKPLDREVIRLAAKHGPIVTLENGSLKGGFGSGVMETLAELHLYPKVLTFGLPDCFIDHGSQELLMEQLGLTAPTITQDILQLLHEA